MYWSTIPIVVICGSCIRFCVCDKNGFSDEMFLHWEGRRHISRIFRYDFFAKEVIV